MTPDPPFSFQQNDEEIMRRYMQELNTQRAIELLSKSPMSDRTKQARANRLKGRGVPPTEEALAEVLERRHAQAANMNRPADADARLLQQDTTVPLPAGHDGQPVRGVGMDSTMLSGAKMSDLNAMTKAFDDRINQEMGPARSVFQYNVDNPDARMHQYTEGDPYTQKFDIDRPHEQMMHDRNMRALVPELAAQHRGNKADAALAEYLGQYSGDPQGAGPYSNAPRKGTSRHERIAADRLRKEMKGVDEQGRPVRMPGESVEDYAARAVSPRAVNDALEATVAPLGSTHLDSQGREVWNEGPNAGKPMRASEMTSAEYTDDVSSRMKHPGYQAAAKLRQEQRARKNVRMQNRQQLQATKRGHAMEEAWFNEATRGMEAKDKGAFRAKMYDAQSKERMAEKKLFHDAQVENAKIQKELVVFAQERYQNWLEQNPAAKTDTRIKKKREIYGDHNVLGVLDNPGAFHQNIQNTLNPPPAQVGQQGAQTQPPATQTYNVNKDAPKGLFSEDTELNEKKEAAKVDTEIEGAISGLTSKQQSDRMLSYDKLAQYSVFGKTPEVRERANVELQNKYNELMTAGKVQEAAELKNALDGMKADRESTNKMYSGGMGFMGY